MSEGIENDGLAFFHKRKTLLVVIADAKKLSFVLQIILQYQSDVWVVVSAVLGHQVENFIGDIGAVFDGSAARKRGRFR